MRIIHIPLILIVAAACGRGDAREADRSASTDTPAVQPARDSVELVARVGRVSVEHARVWNYNRWVIQEARLEVDERVILAEELTEGMGVFAVWPVSGARSLYVVANNPGGTACENEFRILDVPPHGDATLSGVFGTCVFAPDTMWFDRSGALWMRFSAFSRIADEEDPEWRPGPPQTWVYRGPGRLEEAR